MDSSATPLQDLRVVVMDLAASLHSLLLLFGPSKLETAVEGRRPFSSTEVGHDAQHRVRG